MLTVASFQFYSRDLPVSMQYCMTARPSRTWLRRLNSQVTAPTSIGRIIGSSDSWRNEKRIALLFCKLLPFHASMNCLAANLSSGPCVGHNWHAQEMPSRSNVAYKGCISQHLVRKGNLRRRVSSGFLILLRIRGVNSTEGIVNSGCQWPPHTHRPRHMPTSPRCLSQKAPTNSEDT
jgi:hypothetical protein